MRAGIHFILLLGGPLSASAWWDEAHMITAAIAQMHVLQADLFNAALECDDGYGEFANFTELVPAATWLDHIKCREADAVQSYCKGLAADASVHLFFPWHFARKTYDPENLGAALPVAAKFHDEFAMPDYNYPTALTALTDVSRTFMNATSAWSWGFHLRVALHIWADMHQPLHTSELYSASFRDGDKGGSDIRLAAPLNKTYANLHMLWDAGAGLMPHFLNQDHFDAEAAMEKAKEFVKDYPAAVFIASKRLSQDWNNAEKLWGIPNTTGFVKSMIADSNALVANVYREYLSSGGADKRRFYLPSADYMKNASTISKQQVALGGYRLASWLNYHARYLPKDGCHKEDAASPKAHPEIKSGGDWLGRVLFCILGVVVGGGVVALSPLHFRSKPKDPALEPVKP